MPLSQVCVARSSAAHPRRWVCSLIRYSFFRTSSSIPLLKTPRPKDETAQKEQRGEWSKARGLPTRQTERTSRRKPVLAENAHLISENLEETLDAHRRANESTLKILKIRNDVPDEQRVIPMEAINDGWRHLDIERNSAKLSTVTVNDYEGHSRSLLIEWQPAESLPYDLRFPWMRELGEHIRNDSPSMIRLNAEIQAADAYFSPSPAEQTAANLAIQDVRELVARYAPTAVRTDVVGSRANGLAHPLSDIDINIVISTEPRLDSSKDSFRVLSELYRLMRFGKSDDPAQELIATQYFAAHARVPIIAATHLPSGLEFQIQSAGAIYGSLEYSKGLTAEFPKLRGLFKIIKRMLSIRGLCNGIGGGITSYPLLNMIATSLKVHEARTEATDAAQQLLQFLDFYSELNFYEQGIIYRPSTFLKSGHDFTSEIELQEWNKFADLVAQDPVGAVPVVFDVHSKFGNVHQTKDSFMMTLYDPANLENDLGKSVKLIKHIQATFLDIRMKLAAAMKEWDARSGKSTDENQRPLPLLAPLIGADYSLYNLERRGLLDTAKKRKHMV